MNRHQSRYVKRTHFERLAIVASVLLGILAGAAVGLVMR
jgi:predicted Zn-dependent protease